MTEPEEAQFRLVMPFVCVVSSGGALDDHAFVCGAAFGAHSTEIRESHPVEWQAFIDPDMVSQYDLLAMSEGYVMSSEPWDEHPDEWVLVSFTLDAVKR